MKKESFGNILFLTPVVVYFFITYNVAIMHTPWFDEMHHWLMLKDLNFVDLLKTIHYEGHPIIWYAILAPFVKLNFPYPFTLNLINWVIFALASFVFLKSSVFAKWEKILILFTLPFFHVYPILARNYSIGILFLFLLAKYYPQRTSRPFLYSLLIIGALNSDTMAMVGATAFCLIFLKDMIAQKKELTRPLYVIICGGFFFCLTMFAPGETILGWWSNGIKPLSLDFFSWSLFPMPAKFASFLLILFGTTFLWLKKSKNAVFFSIFTFYSLIVIFSFIYNGYNWHHWHIFIYFIISIWLFRQDGYKSKFINFCLAFISLTFIIMPKSYLIKFPTPDVKIQLYKNLSQNGAVNIVCACEHELYLAAYVKIKNYWTGDYNTANSVITHNRIEYKKYYKLPNKDKINKYRYLDSIYRIFDVDHYDSLYEDNNANIVVRFKHKPLAGKLKDKYIFNKIYQYKDHKNRVILVEKVIKKEDLVK